MPQYVPTDPMFIPDHARFSVPERNGGQHIEVAYGGFDANLDHGSLYKRVTDLTLPVTHPDRVRYFKRTP